MERSIPPLGPKALIKFLVISLVVPLSVNAPPVQGETIEKSAEVERVIAERLDAGEDMPPRVDDPGYPIVFCVYSNVTAEVQEIVTIGEQDYLCSTSTTVKAILKWRAWFCRNDRDCALSHWPDGLYPSSEYYPVYNYRRPLLDQSSSVGGPSGTQRSTFSVYRSIWYGPMQEEVNKLVDASMTGNMDEVREFVALGLNVDRRHDYTKERDHIQPLTAAAWGGHLDVVLYLLEHGATDLDAAVTAAARKGRLGILQTLINHGGDVPYWAKTFKRRGHTFLCELALIGRADVYEYLSSSEKWALKSDDYRQCLLNMAGEFKSAAVTMLMDRERSLEMSQSLLDEVLLQVVASPGSSGIEPQRTEIALNLLAAGADCSAQYATGESVLQQASWRGSTAIVRALIDCGVDINMQSKTGSTALIRAVYGAGPIGGGGKVDQENIAVIRVLLQNGADPALKNKSGHTADKVARREKRSCRSWKKNDCSGFDLIRDMLRNAQ